MAFQVTSTSINPNHVKRSTYMRSRNPVVLRFMLAAVVLVACSCTVLAPGADRVKFAQNAADVAGCKVVGNVSGLFRVGDSQFYSEDQLRNRTVGLDVIDALGRGAFSSLRWTLVRAGLNARGKDERPVASADWDGA